MATAKIEGTVPAIYPAILAIQKDMPTLEKNGVGPQTQGGYKFLAVDDVLLGVKPLLNSNGVFVHAELLDHGFHYNGAIAKDNERVPRESIQAWVKYAFHFVAAQDGSEVVSTVIGEGIDTQDKAIRKATTSAWKIALIQTFSLVTGEVDPDAQDGAAAAQEAGATGGPSRAVAAASKPAPAAKPKADNKAELQGEIKTLWATRQKDDTTLAPMGYREYGEKVTGLDKSVWMIDTAQLQKVVDALKAGEVH